MIKLFSLTLAAIFTAEALVMLFLESLGEHLSLPLRVFLDSSLLMICLFPSLYFLVFREMAEQIRLRQQAEKTQHAWTQSLELVVEERTERLQRANEDLLIEVQERAKAAMALRKALNEARSGREQLRAIIDAVNDSLVVVDAQWNVLIVNQAAETMFGANAYDIKGHSLKEFLLPWSESPADIDRFFSRDNVDPERLLLPPEPADGKRLPVRMRFGAELTWEEQPATVLMFFYQKDLPADELPPVRLT